MSHPYRPLPIVPSVPHVPWWRRLLCALGKHRYQVVADRGVFVCVDCPGERGPSDLRDVIAIVRERKKRGGDPLRLVSFVADPPRAAHVAMPSKGGE